MKKATLMEFIIERARLTPQHRTLVFIHDDGTEEEISADGFLRKTVHYARALHSIGIKADDLVILVLQHSPELLYSFWGAIYLGAIPSILLTAEY
jgi:acyl-CoA synthetase (AMP-forming)/AMP-acid ligase II